MVQSLINYTIKKKINLNIVYIYYTSFINNNEMIQLLLLDYSVKNNI